MSVRLRQYLVQRGVQAALERTQRCVIRAKALVQEKAHQPADADGTSDDTSDRPAPEKKGGGADDKA